jgi:hypothetical protein
MIGVLKSLQGFLDKLDIPEAVTLFGDILWRLRWFIMGALVLVGLYNMFMVALPFLLWSFVIKSGVSFLVSLFA